MKKLLTVLASSVLSLACQATVLFQDSSNYPYANGPIEGQGQWYCYSSKTNNDIFVTNNVILFNATNNDYIAAPSSGFYSPYNSTLAASFNLNISQAPGFNNYNGGYFLQFVSTNANECCNLFISTNGTVIPGTFRLSIANFSVSFSNIQQPVTYPVDLFTNVTYNVVIYYDTEFGAFLFIDPTENDYFNALNDGEGNAIQGTLGSGYVYATDKAINSARAQVTPNAIGFQPYFTGGISNVIVGTLFDDVFNTTNLPVFGIQPAPGTNYSGNAATFTALAAGSDLTYQWYSTSSGKLSDGVAYSGSTSNILTVNNLVGTDSYYVIATDAYGQTATSASATEYVNTTPTPVFFGTNVVAVSITNNPFSPAAITDVASGTGPIQYQWYYATNAVYSATSKFAALPGATNASISPTYVGEYYVLASNTVSGGTLAIGPTNIVAITPPQAASIQDLNNYLNSSISLVLANPGGTVYLNNGNVQVSGYVNGYSGYGSTFNSFFLQDTNGYGINVFLGSNGNTNTPPIGANVTVTAPVETYHATLEMYATSKAQLVTNFFSTNAIIPFLGNPFYSNFVANPLSTNTFRYENAVVTFTNVYLYGTSTGGALGSGNSYSGVGGIFTSNSYVILYATVGAPYDAVTNNKTMEFYCRTYNLLNSDGTRLAINPFSFKPIPSHLAQLTGIFQVYGGTPSYVEVIPTRYEDLVTNAPAPSLAASLITTNLNVSWLVNTGSTYSVLSGTNLTGPWKKEVSGLGYYPSVGSFQQTVTPGSSRKFYQVTTP